MKNNLEGFEYFYKQHCLDCYGEFPDLNWIFEKHENGQYIQGEVEAASKTWQNKQTEIEHLRMILWFVKDHFEMNGLDKAMPRVYEKLKGATTDIIKPNHNTSCTYQFELAFHNLQDTPELRKIYWSALGQLQFDSNDQVIPPELEECPCCKPLIRKIGTETEGYETYEIGVDERGVRYGRHPHGDWELLE